MLVDVNGNPLKTENDRTPYVVSSRARQTIDVADGLLTGGMGGFESPRPNADWTLSQFTENALTGKSFDEMVQTLINTSPDLDRALHDTLQFANTEWTLTTEEDDSYAQNVLDNAINQMESLKEPLSVKIAKMISGIFIYGSAFIETIFDGAFDQNFVDIRVITPTLARFRKQRDEVRGQYDQLGQQIQGDFRPLNSPYIQYIPFNPVPGNPYGRSMIGSAIFPMVFLLGLIKSARQVIEMQAWPRQLATISREALRAGGVDPKDFDNMLKRIESKIDDCFKNAPKGAMFTFGDEVDIKTIGSMTRASMDGLDMMERILERWIIRGTKQYPILFGVNEGSALNAGNANQQLEAYNGFIVNIQSKGIESPLISAFTWILRNAGSSATPVFTLARDNSLVVESRTKNQKEKIEAISILRRDGLITVEEARKMLSIPESLWSLDDILAQGVPAELLGPSIDEIANQDNNGDENDE